ncbi:MAG: LysE family transporter [Chlamydiae bacterium]|nr:LysE family transporter [Chlamydiota bacterium]
MLNFFWKGICIGFLLALPLGPTMVLCIRYSLAFGAVIGLVTGAGAGLADAIYGVVAGYGIYTVVDFMDKYRLFFHFLGSGILCYLGVKTLREHLEVQSEKVLVRRPHMLHLFMTTFTLTLTSPLTFIGVSALCASFGVEESSRSLLSPWVLGIGLFLGSCLWWQILSSILAFFKKKVTSHSSQWIGRISGSILLLLGLCLFVYSLIVR